VFVLSNSDWSAFFAKSSLVAIFAINLIKKSPSLKKKKFDYILYMFEYLLLSWSFKSETFLSNFAIVSVTVEKKFGSLTNLLRNSNSFLSFYLLAVLLNLL
jgi:hypothetical protein